MVDNNRDWDDYNRQIAVQGRQILERTGESIQRSNQIAIETEAIGTEVISELNDQREALLRTKSRLENADEQLDSAKAILRRMGRNIVYNRLILILIIIMEVGILIGISYIKFIK
ncbi:vesicle transport through interaction with t-SNAREs homolog 1B [Coccinella septempunctata]|uniref:vesicle transport through interaction with t-SNAREs homolog 1B n=1 Tax=Coccinella septempunctata TaxID=41139 RepID=UPI001D0998D7|nr:vesicle transport through interaction with t-SNAREs homolog 1B [Coccinella septempunctata]